MLDTRYKRVGALAVTSLALAAAPAGAGEIPLLGTDGKLTERAEPGVAVRDRTPLPPGTHRRASAPRPAAHAARKTPLGELSAFRTSGRIDEPTFSAARKAYTRAKSLGRRLSGRRGVELRGVVGVVDGIAARGRFTVSRVPVLTLTLQRNAEWWGGDGSLLASGARVGFEDSELVWQSVPGQGIQFHPLANFGKLNALFKQKFGAAKMEQLLDELLPLRAGRAGGTAWEYYYEFGGGNPPWVSSLSQGAGV